MAGFDRKDPHEWADDVEGSLDRGRTAVNRQRDVLLWLIPLAIFGSLGEFWAVGKWVYEWATATNPVPIAPPYPTDEPAPDGISQELWQYLSPEDRACWHSDEACEAITD